MRVRNIMIRNKIGNGMQTINRCRRFIETYKILQIRKSGFSSGRLSNWERRRGISGGLSDRRSG
jgi:hypothetical protein